MEIKVKRATGSNNQTTSLIDLGLSELKIPERAKARIKSDVGDYLKEQIVSSAVNAKSPVEGEEWPALSPTYRKHKQAEGLPGKANLEFSGDLLDALDYDATKEGIEIGWKGSQAGKADGHANLSGDSSLPQRRLIPDVGQEFVAPIQKEIEKIVSDAVLDEMDFNAADFSAVTTQAELYDVLSEYFGGDFTAAEIKRVITRAPQLAAFLDDEGLLDLL